MIAKIDSDSSRMRRWTPRKGGGSHPFDNDGGLLSVLFELNADRIALTVTEAGRLASWLHDMADGRWRDHNGYVPEVVK